jgi:hypothetical protein
MTRPLRAVLLVLVLMLQGLAQAWALPPPAASAVAQDESAMPCHDGADMPDRMPCCDDEPDCRCSPACLGATGALAPVLPAAGEMPSPPVAVAAVPPVPLPAHPSPLLRPPASFAS